MSLGPLFVEQWNENIPQAWHSRHATHATHARHTGKAAHATHATHTCREFSMARGVGGFQALKISLS